MNIAAPFISSNKFRLSVYEELYTWGNFRIVTCLRLIDIFRTKSQGCPFEKVIWWSFVKRKQTFGFPCSVVDLKIVVHLFQISTRNVSLMAIISTLAFILLPFLQFWVFTLYHRFGHPWSCILHPNQDVIKRKSDKKSEDADLKYFAQFWDYLEGLEGSQDLVSKKVDIEC